MVPYQQNKRFIGREHLLESLKATLFDQEEKHYNHTIALYGLGGIGKTQIALEYVYANQVHYQRIYWVSAATQAALVAGYQQIAKKVGLESVEGGSPTDFIPQLLLWFRQSESWLLIVDNLDDLTVLNPATLFPQGDGANVSPSQTLLPENGPLKHTIITTRNRYADWIPAEGVEIPLLSPDEASNMLFTLVGIRKYGLDDEGQALEIVKELGCLPLAIEQAAAYIAQECDKTLSKFLLRYKKNRPKILKRVSFVGRQYSESVATTWTLSVNAVRARNTEATCLLSFLAYLAPDFISISLLKAGCDGLDEDLKHIIADDEAFDNALFMLQQFSLLKRETTEDGDSLVMHRLVQAFLQDEMQANHSKGADIKRQWSNVIGLGYKAFPIPWAHTVESRRRCRQFQNQLLAPLMACPRINTDQIQKLLERIGWFLNDEGKLKDAETIHYKAYLISNEFNGGEHPDTLRAMTNLATSYWKQGRWDDSVKLEEKVLENSKTLGDQHPDTLTAMANLATSYRMQGRWDESVKLEEKVLENRKTLLGDQHPDTLTSMANLAATYRMQGRWDDSVKLEEKVLQNSKTLLGDQHPHTLNAMANLAATYWQQGRWDDSVKDRKSVV